MSFTDKKNMYWVTSDLDFVTAEAAQACLAELHSQIGSSPLASLTEDAKKIKGTHFIKEIGQIIAEYVQDSFQITCLFTNADNQASGGWVNFYDTNGSRTAMVDLDQAFLLLPKKRDVVVSINSNNPCFDEYSLSELKEKYQKGLDDGSLTLDDVSKELGEHDTDPYTPSFTVSEVSRHILTLNDYDHVDYFMLLKA